jgi:glycosyltransferase involved in cell wall biosynthesis
MRLTRVKRTLPLARILGQVARHVEVRATVVGDGPQRSALMSQLRSHRLDGVHLTGTVDRNVVRRELAAASIFLAPAHRESFGIAALEARASGLPVVASARSGVASYITHGVDGLLGDTDEDLAGHLLRLLTDDGLRRALTEHNRAVPPRCSWPDADAARADVYAAALAARRNPRAVPPRRLVSS